MSKYCYKSNTVSDSFYGKHSGFFKCIDSIVEEESFHKETKKYECDDYKNIFFGKKAKALHLDYVAKKIHPNPSSVDMIFTLDNGKFLAVEFKLNKKRIAPLGLGSKIKETNNLLKCSGKAIEKFIAIICNSSVGKNYLNKISTGNPPKNCEVMFLEDLKKNYF